MECSICGKQMKPWHPNSTGYGNNAQPVTNGRCCDDCNTLVVLPMRVARMQQGLDPREVNIFLHRAEGNHRKH